MCLRVLIVLVGIVAVGVRLPVLCAEESPEIEKARARRKHADELAGAGKHEAAVTAYREALELLEAQAADAAEVAEALNMLGLTLVEMGALAGGREALERALVLRRSAHGGDHLDVVASLDSLADAYLTLGRLREALPLLEEALAMCRRLHEGDSPGLALTLNTLGRAYFALGRRQDAVPLFEESLAMRRRILGGDHPVIATGLNNLASAYWALGRTQDALPLIEEALAMSRRLFEGDHPEVAVNLSNLAGMRAALGRPQDALPLLEEALAMERRLFAGDHPGVSSTLNNLAHTYRALGRPRDALPPYEEALAMSRRLFDGDHPDLVVSLTGLAATYWSLGRQQDALPLDEEALAMSRRLFEGDHPDLVVSLSSLAATYRALGRPQDALPLLAEGLAVSRRLFQGDHPDVVLSLNNLAAAYGALRRPQDALRLKEEALAMSRRLHEGDHPDVARSLNNLAATYGNLGRPREGLPFEEEALGMRRRLFEGDHPDVVASLESLAAMYDALGRPEDALPLLREAAGMAERLGWARRHIPLTALASALIEMGRFEEAAGPLARALEHLETLRAQASSLSGESRGRYVQDLRAGADPFALMVSLQIALGRPREALAYLERGRAREMLDLLERSRVDVLARARERASGDEEALARLDAVEREIDAAERAVLEREQAVERARRRGEGSREGLRRVADAASEARRALLGAQARRLRAVREVLPEAAPLAPETIQALLREGERMLVYSLGEEMSFAFLVGPPDIEMEVFRLGVSLRSVAEAVDAYDRTSSQGRRLFELLVPQGVWQALVKSKRVYVVPHGPLHRLPFEALVVGEGDGGPRYWVDEGPPIAYVASASVLSWLRSRRGEGAGGPSLVAVGDPLFGGKETPWPEKGVLVRDLVPGGQAVALGVRPGDVLVGYGGKEVSDLETLRAATASVSEGTGAVPVRFVREGAERVVEARPGKLGIVLAAEPPPAAGPKLLARTVRGAAGRYARLVPLPGTRKEVEAIRKVFLGSDGNVVVLLGADATEERLFEAARGARYLHLATHGLVDETESASFSALALARPRMPVPGDDGFLTLGDLLERWRGRLDGAELVVLSACESQMGRLERDEGMFALPWGFCFAGAPAAIASLWKVDDESTARLMADFYGRLLSEGGPGPCEALHAARRALRGTHPDPHHWAPFVFVGAP